MYKFKSDILWRIKDKRFHDVIGFGDGVIGTSARGTSWLAGGAFRGLVDKHDILCDFDLFFSNALRAAEVGLDLEARGFKMVFKCPKGELTTYIKLMEADFTDLSIKPAGYQTMKVQLITKNFYSNAEQMLSTFDINAARFAYDGEFIYTDRSALRSAKKREVTLHNVTHPNATFKRMLKYRDKGFKITNEAVDFFTQKVYDMGVVESVLQREFYVD